MHIRGPRRGDLLCRSLCARIQDMHKGGFCLGLVDSTNIYIYTHTHFIELKQAHPSPTWFSATWLLSFCSVCERPYQVLWGTTLEMLVPGRAVYANHTGDICVGNIQTLNSSKFIHLGSRRMWSLLNLKSDRIPTRRNSHTSRMGFYILTSTKPLRSNPGEERRRRFDP